MKKNNFETSIIADLKDKMLDDKNNFEIMNMVYTFLVYKQDVNWNCRNLDLAGIGEIIKSNNVPVEDIEDVLSDISKNYNILIIKNSLTSEFNCLLVPPSKPIDTCKASAFTTASSCFDSVENGTEHKNNLIIKNDLNDEVEIYPHAFENLYSLTDFLSPKAIQLNDVICNSIINDNIPSFSKIYEEINRDQIRK